MLPNRNNRDAVLETKAISILLSYYLNFGNVTCAGYPLDDIDTIGKDGSLNDTSALNIIVRGVR